MLRFRGQNRTQVIFLVDGKGFPFLGRQQMNGQVTDSQYGSLDLYQTIDNVTILLSYPHASRQTQISIKPRVPQSAPVTFDAELSHLGGRSQTPRFDT
eukprot:scaffold587_cov171-Amphora_coffeaeformis.AAC.2